MDLNKEPAIKGKNYDEESYKKVEKKSYGVAKRGIVLLEIGSSLVIPMIFSFLLWLVYAPISHSLHNDDPSNMFLLLDVILKVVLPVLAISLILGMVSYVRLQIMNTHLGKKLDGVVEAQEMATGMNFGGSLSRATGCTRGEAIASLGILVLIKSVITLMNSYLIANNQKPIKVKLFKLISVACYGAVIVWFVYAIHVSVKIDKQYEADKAIAIDETKKADEILLNALSKEYGFINNYDINNYSDNGYDIKGYVGENDEGSRVEIHFTNACEIDKLTFRFYLDKDLTLEENLSEASAFIEKANSIIEEATNEEAISLKNKDALEIQLITDEYKKAVLEDSESERFFIDEETEFSKITRRYDANDYYGNAYFDFTIDAKSF